MPIAVIVSRHVCPNMPADRLLRDQTPTSLAAEIFDFCRDCGCESRALSTFYLSIDATYRTCYMGYELKLTQQEARLLKCLFYRYPFPTQEEDLTLLCAHNAKQTPPPVAELIRRINRRAAAIDPRTLIVRLPDHTYRLREGIV